MKYGIIDIGSNTMRLNLYLITDKGNIISLLNKKNVAGLATYVNKRLITKKGADKLIKILNNFLEICEYFEIDEVKIFATAVIRNAKNRNEILDYVEEAIGTKIDLLSGEEEATYGYLGIKEDYDFDTGYIVDIGGGSVEITAVQDREVIFSTSIKEGHLSIFKKNVERIMATKNEAKKIRKTIRKLIREEEIPILDDNGIIYGTGGTIRAAGNIAMEVFDLPTNKIIYKDTIDKLYIKLLANDKKTMRTVLQVVPERVHTIIPGIIILREILKQTGCKEIHISKKGVREGYLINSIKEVV